jgi:pimeloyl-ACP methyl ester carboxylesterase
MAAWFAIVTLIGCREATQAPDPGQARHTLTSGVEADDGANVVTIDHLVPHVSTVPANSGETVHLFVRERVRSNPGDGKPREAVLMIHGRSVPVLAAGELRYHDYDWAYWLASSGGFDVFMLDFQGSGRSPRPKMDDPCNIAAAQQQGLLIPNPLSATCPPSYGFTLNTAGSDLDELDRVVDYIRDLRGIDKVHLIGWSAGSFRIGAYGVQHPDKVASLLFFAPIFNAGIEPGFPVPPTNPPSPLPRLGTPMTLDTRAVLAAGWDAEVKCVDQRDPGIQDVVWAAIMENDELGRTWGPPPAGGPAGSPPEGVMRVRQLVQWGWNAEVAAQLEVPSLIIRGEFDTGLGGRQHLAELYRLIRTDNKLRFTVQCAGHFMNWEKQRVILHQISKEWIKHGRVGGFERGEFLVDTEGNLIAP